MNIPFKKLFSSFLGIALLIGISFGVLTVFESYPLRLDFTKNKMYSLSPSTKELLRTLEDPVHITAYFSTSFPQESKENTTKTYVENTLKEMQIYAGKKLDIQIVDPKGDESKRQQAESAGILPIQLNTIKNDSYSVEVGYLGLMVVYEDKKEIIPFFQNALSPEYELSTRIRKLTSKKLPTVGVLQGKSIPKFTHGADKEDSFEIFIKNLSSSYTVVPVDEATTKKLPEDIQTIIIAGTKEDISKETETLLMEASARGIHIVLAQNFDTISTENGISKTTLSLPHLQEFISSLGVEVRKGLVASTPGKQIGVTSQRGMIMMQQLVEFPLIPVLTPEDSLLTRGIRSITIPFASPITSSGSKFNTIIQSSKNAHLYTTDGPLNPLDSSSFFGSGSGATFPLALMSSTENGQKEGKVFALGSSSCLLDQIVQSTQDKSCVDLVLNAVDWTMQDKNTMEVRNKISENRPLRTTSPEEKLFYKIIALGLPSSIILGFGIIRFIRRNRRATRTYHS